MIELLYAWSSFSVDMGTLGTLDNSWGSRAFALRPPYCRLHPLWKFKKWKKSTGCVVCCIFGHCKLDWRPIYRSGSPPPPSIQVPNLKKNVQWRQFRFCYDHFIPLLIRGRNSKARHFCARSWTSCFVFNKIFSTPPPPPSRAIYLEKIFEMNLAMYHSSAVRYIHNNTPVRKFILRKNVPKRNNTFVSSQVLNRPKNDVSLRR